MLIKSKNHINKNKTIIIISFVHFSKPISRSTLQLKFDINVPVHQNEKLGKNFDEKAGISKINSYRTEAGTIFIKINSNVPYFVRKIDKGISSSEIPARRSTRSRGTTQNYCGGLVMTS